MDTTVFEKLQNLYTLQEVDSKLDEFKVLKGELPMEVNDLEDEVVGLEKRIENGDQAIRDNELEIARLQGMARDADNNIKRYKRQMDEVKNNREYEALTKEINLSQLDIKLAEKKEGEILNKIEMQKEALDVTKAKFEAKKKDLEVKRVELQAIIEKTEKDEEKYVKQSEKARKKIEERLLKAYDRIRKNYRNGLAVVTVERDSCGGCFNYVPPQVQLEVGLHDKVMACEHCGRILIDESVVNNEVPA